MPVDLTLRSEVGPRLTATQHDENLLDIQSAINAAEARLDASLDENGKFKPGSLDDVTAIVDSLITLAKLTAGTAKAFLTSDAAGAVTALTGTDGQIAGWTTADVPAALNPEDVFEATAGVFLYDNPVNRVNQTSTQASWLTLDLTTDIAALNATDATAVILQLETFLMEEDIGTPTNREILLRVTSDNATSTSSTSTHRSRVYAYGSANQRFPCGADVNTAIVALDGNNVYWNTTFTNSTVGSYAKISVAGFLRT